MLSRLAFPLVITAILASACTAPPDDALEFRTDWGCQTCTENSPRTNDFKVASLHRYGLPNEDNVSLVGLRHPNGTLYTADAVDDEFVARDSNGNIVASAGDLAGWDLVLDQGGHSIDVHIWAHDPEVESWALNAAPISTYALNYVDINSPVELYNLCPTHRLDPFRTTVTLIVGERYDPESKTVLANQPDWITLACEDEATFKMKRLNYGPNDEFNGQGDPATANQRQATLKMITADYCGTGQSFTAQGTDIVWENVSGSVSANRPPDAKFEAQWTADGATCLDTPRFVDIADVLSVCSLPSCGAVAPDVEWLTNVP